MASYVENPLSEPSGSASTAPGIRSEVKKPKKKKVLLMGKSGSGKSSMRSIIFSNYIARDTRRFSADKSPSAHRGATIDIDLSHVKFLGNLTLNLWDCGGQEAFMENYLSQQRVHVFSNVGVLIYVFDIESRDVDRDLATYVAILSALLQFSPTAKIYILIHKMDLVVPSARESMYDDRVRLVRQKTAEFAHSLGSGGGSSTGEDGSVDLVPFATSIWDQSLYKAWASIIHDLVPNLSVIERNLANLGLAIEAEELLLFERTSFLAVSSWTSPEGQRNPTEDRLERMSNIMKHFKQSISRFTGTPRNAEQFIRMEHKAGMRFSLFILKFTTNTYLMVVLPPGEARFNAAMLNCQIAIQHFKFLDGPAAQLPSAAAAPPPTTA
ncbi:Ras-related GTP-binding protein A-like protein [Hapsidospora chrysogenum ATCC 11550]|uniref:GTP-binding protein n=1 Tax=Hapsidospora chrysogenum (strain ATCC 11550 / CBS 779.69 / DSM 880 / IAM 14645 / JCM 23072 / IMI 49137) TaxID=857340 RepID=A0A086TB48_HAPC1|nr:Ras-related GTP-binding protein A-like protein [Hapsidospora chrysogenum ATCC 11550]